MSGLYFEEFEIGKVYEHAITRTVSEMDNVLFTCLTHNPQPLHLDAHFASKTEWGKPLVNSLFTLGLMIGVSVGDTTLGTTIGNLGMTDVKFPHPVFHGDTLRSTTEVAAKRESKSRPNVGIVKVKTVGFTESGKVVIEFQRTFMVYRRGHVPPRAAVPEPKK